MKHFGTELVIFKTKYIFSKYSVPVACGVVLLT